MMRKVYHTASQAAIAFIHKNEYNITMYTIPDLYQHIHILNVAKSECKPEWSWISDVNRWTGFHLWFVLSGGAQIRVEQEEYHLVAGDFFLFDLSRNHYCTHDPQHPLTVYSVYFHTDGALLPTPFAPQKSIGQFALHSALFEQLLQADEANNEAHNLWFTPILHQFLTAPPRRATSQEPENAAILQVRRGLDSHPERPFCLDALCRQIGYSKNHFIRLFKTQTGKTPYEYYLERKIEKAKQLILYSNMSQSDIAAALNYADSNHFVKQFTKRVGVTPRQYRKAD